MITIFGYGSLLNVESLKATVPGALDLRPSYVTGFRREFTLPVSAGITETGRILGPYCALNVRKVPDGKAKVNGVTFKVSEVDLARLIERELKYQLIETSAAHDFRTNMQVSQCLICSANVSAGGFFDFDLTAQMSYLQVCLEGAIRYGERFYQEFLHTTFIGNRPLSEFPRLTQICSLRPAAEVS